jgi:UDP-glucose 4-epimerase
MPSKRKVLITGGAGFIGSHAVDNFLKKGFNVRVIDNLIGGNLKNIEHLKNNSDFQFEKKDILNLGKIKKFIYECEYVVHFAGIGDIVPSIKYPKKYFENNVLGTVKSNGVTLTSSSNIKEKVGIS